jgi:hypothetical protein
VAQYFHQLLTIFFLEEVAVVVVLLAVAAVAEVLEQVLDSY